MDPTEQKALWKYSHTGQERGIWSTVESPRKSAQTWPEWLESHGYECLLAESLAILLPLTLYGRREITEQTQSWEYFVLVHFGSTLRPIAISDLPSLLLFLQNYAPVRRPIKRGLDSLKPKRPIRA
jgi:hypothetical protein